MTNLFKQNLKKHSSIYKCMDYWFGSILPKATVASKNRPYYLFLPLQSGRFKNLYFAAEFFQLFL